MRYTPDQLWEKLRSKGKLTPDDIPEIERIDKMTHWTPREPSWWCEMMVVYRKLLIEKKST